MKGQVRDETRRGREEKVDCTCGMPRVRSGLKFQALVTKLVRLTARNAQLTQVPVPTAT